MLEREDYLKQKSFTLAKELEKAGIFPLQWVKLPDDLETGSAELPQQEAES